MANVYVCVRSQRFDEGDRQILMGSIITRSHNSIEGRCSGQNEMFTATHRDTMMSQPRVDNFAVVVFRCGGVRLPGIAAPVGAKTIQQNSWRSR
jgi:hypothetical protein